MRHAILAAAVGMAALVHGTPARSSTGGPDLIEVLGWDPGDRKVFVAQHYRGESGYPPAFAYFDLGGRSPGRPVVVPWSVASDDQEYRRREGALRARLRPLPSVPAASIFGVSKVLAKDVVTLNGGERTRYRVRVSRLHHDWGGAFEVVTYDDPSVRVLSVHPIPGRRERLAILSFFGIPHESGYETQVPVILETLTDTTRVEWAPFRR